jgi:hypothetical protein
MAAYWKALHRKVDVRDKNKLFAYLRNELNRSVSDSVTTSLNEFLLDKHIDQLITHAQNIHAELN